MAVRNWEKDFRCNAVSASVAATDLRHLRQGDDPFALPLSFCLPVSRYAMNFWNPCTVLAICLAAFFGILVTGALTFPLKEIDNMPPGMEANLWSALIIATMLFAFSVVIVPLIYADQMLMKFVGRRGRALLGLSEKSGCKIICAGVTDPEEFNPNKVPEDFVMILIDNSTETSCDRRDDGAVSNSTTRHSERGAFSTTRLRRCENSLFHCRSTGHRTTCFPNVFDWFANSRAQISRLLAAF